MAVLSRIGAKRRRRREVEQSRRFNTKLLYSSNLDDRTFYLHQRQLWERRWTGSSWQWLHHSHVSNFLNDESSIGVLLGNTSEDVGALYIRNAEGRYPILGSLGVELTEAKWLIYRFRLSATDPTILTQITKAPYPLIEHVALPTLSSLQASDSWKLYAQIAVANYSQGPTSGALTSEHTGGVGIARFDVDLKPEMWRACSQQMFDPVFEIAGGVGVATSDHDVFVLTDVTNNQKDNLRHVDVPFDLATHSGKRLTEISDGKEPDIARIFGVQRDGDLFERVYANGSWKWHKHGRPVARRHFVSVAPGSMRQTRNKVFYIATVKWSSPRNRIYERWTDGSGGWWWADHGYPENERVTEIGHHMHESFFVATSSGNLWQRHWRSAEGRWAWENHGPPP